MQQISEKTKYIARVWPKAHRNSAASTQDLLQRLKTLRQEISARWPQGISAVDEIRDQRTKVYGFNNR